MTRSVSGARDLAPGLGAGRRPGSRLFHRDWGVTEAAVCGGPRPGFRALSAATGGTQPLAGGDAGVRRVRAEPPRWAPCTVPSAEPALLWVRCQDRVMIKHEHADQKLSTPSARSFSRPEASVYCFKESELISRSGQTGVVSLLGVIRVVSRHRLPLVPWRWASRAVSHPVPVRGMLAVHLSDKYPRSAGLCGIPAQPAGPRGLPAGRGSRAWLLRTEIT